MSGPAPAVGSLRRHRRHAHECIAFVLGGGGLLGAAEVGMLRALRDVGVVPDLVLGTSVGALNGVAVAADPLRGVDWLVDLWHDIEEKGPFDSGFVRRAATLARSGTHLHTSEDLRRLVDDALPVDTFEELTVPFQCVAASIERAGPRWFDSGPLLDAVVASAAVPGLFEPVEVDGEHHYDGGLVHSIPLGRAIQLGATCIQVLQVGRIERPLQPPTNLVEVGMVAFEVARRHRFVEELAAVPPEVDVHVLPTGDAPAPTDVRTQLRYADASTVDDRMAAAYTATKAYLDAEGMGTDPSIVDLDAAPEGGDGEDATSDGEDRVDGPSHGGG